MNNIKTKTVYALGIVFVFFVTAGIVWAENGFIALEPIPGVTDAENPGDFFNSIFRFGITIASFLAVMRIMIGGITYMSTDKIGGKESGKDMITQAILGILLILISVIMLEVINPDILNLNLFR